MGYCRVLESGVGYMTQPFHYAGQKGYDYDHFGVDLVDFSAGYAMLGWAVAHSEGVVVETRNNCNGFEYNSYGNYVLLRHPNGMYTLYAHFAYGTVQVSVGQSVSKGTRLGYLGNTGTSYGGHLHWECRNSDGTKIDPEPYLTTALPGMPSTNWVRENGYWYLYDQVGNMLKGWQNVGGVWYFLDRSTGRMVTGWLYDNSYKGWFYFEPSGAMVTGWKFINGKWYYLSPATSNNNIKGKMQTGWVFVKNKWYYLQEKQDSSHKQGEMRTGWYFDNNYKCWFLLADTGEMLTGWQQRGIAWYYLYKETADDHVKGQMRVGWMTYKGTKYYLSPKKTKQFKEGQMVTGTVKIDGKTYKFGDNGALIGKV